MVKVTPNEDKGRIVAAALANASIG